MVHVLLFSDTFTFEYANDKVCAEHLENILQLQKPLPNL